MGTSTDPVYLRVLDDLRHRISSGLLEPGARVPSRNAIIARYGVGETAAKHALAVLAAEGLIEARPGSGSYVRHAPVTRYLEHGRLGHPGSPFGLAGPKGMDPKVVKIIHDAFKKGMEERSYLETIAKIDQEPFYLNTEDYRAFVRRTVPEQKQLMEELGFKPE